jgi:hypothetical protein
MRVAGTGFPLLPGRNLASSGSCGSSAAADKNSGQSEIAATDASLPFVD